jgi:hypothetical protein
MDLARIELSRILAWHNPFSNCIESDEQPSSHKYYFLDCKGTNEYGDHALHRLCALHINKTAIHNFLAHRKEHERIHNLRPIDDALMDRYDDLPDPIRVDAANHVGVTALHVAVYRNAWHVEKIVRRILEECPRLASIPMKCGTYPLHIVTGHNLTISPSVIDYLLQVDPTVVWNDDCYGDNPLSLLWKNVLRFRWSHYCEMFNVIPEMHKEGDMSWMTVISPEQFCDYCLRMIAAAQGVYNPEHLTWHDVCRMPRCPPLLIRLLLSTEWQHKIPYKHLSRSRLMQTDRHGQTPLHIACATAPTTLRYVPQEIVDTFRSVVSLFVGASPDAALVLDKYGCCPLHYLVGNTPVLQMSHVYDVLELVNACPEALSIQNPTSGLYPLQEWAQRLQQTDELDSSLASLDVLYGLLRTNPNVVTYHRLGDNHMIASNR